VREQLTPVRLGIADESAAIGHGVSLPSVAILSRLIRLNHSDLAEGEKESVFSVLLEDRKSRSVPNVTSEPSDPQSDGQAAPAVRAQTLALQGLANRLVLVLLRTPLLCRAIGARLVVLHVVGRKSGRRYIVPVAYTGHDGDLLIGTPFAWGRNLRTGEPLEIRLKGQLRRADVQVFTDEAGVTEHYAAMARDNRNFAKFNKIGLDQDGNPDPSDLRLAWAAGARAFLLTPH
jgi:hypothetical protein